MSKLTHIDETGRARMVDVSDKAVTTREAVAEGFVRMSAATLALALAGEGKKGDVRAVAEIAGVMAAKRTSDLIPMCHPLNLLGVDLSFELLDATHTICITAEVKVFGKTGVEMEALTAVTIAALTIYDMCKAVDKDMVIQNIYLKEKIGGKSGHYQKV